MNKKFEIYNTATEEVVQTVETTQAFADKANKLAREIGNPLRYIEQRPQPSSSCRCGAESAYECVCC